MRLALLVAGAFFMENLDVTVITPALPAMAESFAVHPLDLNVGVSAYMSCGLPFAFLPIVGTMILLGRDLGLVGDPEVDALGHSTTGERGRSR